MSEYSYPDYAGITRMLRAMYGSYVLIAAVCELNVFEKLRADRATPVEELLSAIGVPNRAGRQVLLPILCSRGLIDIADDQVTVTSLGLGLFERDGYPDLLAYIGLEADCPGAREMAELLRKDEGAGQYCQTGDKSPMDAADLARHLTLALTDRAQILSPIVAAKLELGNGHLVDAGGGSGWFTFWAMHRYPQARATIVDHENVLVVAREQLDVFCQRVAESDSVRDRIEFAAGNMFDRLPQADAVLMASVVHDWGFERAGQLAQFAADALNSGGRLWFHECLLDDSLAGSAAAADYSAQLWKITWGCCYSRAQFSKFTTAAGLSAVGEPTPTQLDYSLFSATKE